MILSVFCRRIHHDYKKNNIKKCFCFQLILLITSNKTLSQYITSSDREHTLTMMIFKSTATLFVAYVALSMACQKPCIKSGSSKSTYCSVLDGCGCVETNGVNLPENTGKACKGKAKYNCKTKEKWTEDKTEWCEAAEICPKGCKMGFDGCNNCRCKGYAKVGWCTKKACKTKEEPMCKMYCNYWKGPATVGCPTPKCSKPPGGCKLVTRYRYSKSSGGKCCPIPCLSMNEEKEVCKIKN